MYIMYIYTYTISMCIMYVYTYMLSASRYEIFFSLSFFPFFLLLVSVYSLPFFFSPFFSFMKPSPATFVLPLCFFSFFLIQSFSDNFVRFLSRSFLPLIFLMLPSPLLFSFFFSYSFFPSRFSHEVVMIYMYILYIYMYYIYIYMYMYSIYIYV